MRPHELEEAVLPRCALAPDLGEPGRDHHERLDAGLECLLGRFENGAPRQRHNRDVDLVGNLGYRAVPPHTSYGLSVSIHRVGSSRKVPGEDVPEQLAAYRASSPGRADHGHAPRLEERPQRRGHGGVVALLDPLAIPLGRGDRELHLELATLELPCQLEPDGPEDAEHVTVVGHDLRDEALDTDLRCPLGEALEEPRPDPAPLVGVGHREGSFCNRRVAKSHVARNRHDLLAGVRAQRSEQSAPLAPVRLEQRLHEPRPERGKAVEAEISAPLGQRSEELEKRVRVVPPGRSQS